MKIRSIPLVAAVATIVPSPCLSFSPQSGGRPTSVVSKPPPSSSSDGTSHAVTSKKRSRTELHAPTPPSTHHHPHPSSTMYSSIIADDDSSSVFSRSGGLEVLHPHSHKFSSTSLGMTYDLTVDEYITVVDGDRSSRSSSRSNNNGLMDILSAALLITGNTVGAGTMVLPNVAAGPGLGMSTALLAGIYCINLVSGLLLAEVAIKQHESSGGDVPSSFKEFAESSLQCSTTANCISSISIFVNWCVLAFALTRAGELASTLLPNLAGLADSGLSLDPTLSAAGVATVLTGLVGTQSNQSLSRVASAAVTVLFASFAGLLLPGLATVHDPIGAFLSPGTICSGDVGCALSTAAPIFLSTMIYQNIVPSVTKLLNYDRQRTTVAITCGSSVPLMVYTAFNLSVLGGGLTTSVSSGGPILTAFVTASLVGSSIAGVMSLSEEFDNVLFNKDGDEAQEEREDGAATASTASLNSVLLAVGPPLLAGSALASGGGATAALDIAGGYCSPLLYGLLPVVMAAKQRNGDRVKSQDGYSDSPQTRNLVPGGMASLGVLGTASTGFILQKLASDVGDVVSSVGLA
mmetsp:Transcript_38021/g.77385  ORF Transcript_38021/g.77385 Transcript_38021/m.77385 type:complete len:576 (-) Transcript_38021:1837-3564(-)